MYYKVGGDYMEQLLQKHIKYFYIALIVLISLQLLDIVITTLMGRMQSETIILMFLSIINIILLSDSMRRNIKQQFTECKETAKILRLTIAPLIVLQALLCFEQTHYTIMLCNHLTIMVIVEIILNYRIRSIEYLEQMASKIVKNDKLEGKGE